jgi:outer membrane protein assembly factor BamB
MINPHLPGLQAVRQDGRSQATTIWRVVVGGKEDQYQSTIRIAPGGADVAADLDADGRYELLASITNEHGDRKQHLVIFDAATGKRLLESGDERVVSVDDLDGDGSPEVVLQGAARMRLAHWVNDRLAEVWHGDGVEPLLRPIPAEGSLSRTAGGNTTIWRETPHSARFLFRFADGVHACRLMKNQVDRGELVATHEALGNAGDGHNAEFESVTWNGSAVVSRKGADEVYRYEPPSLQTYLAPPPLVADLDGSRQVLVRDANGKILLVPASGGKGRVLIENAFERFQTHVDHSSSGPTICDMDGDGENDVVATLTGTDGKPFCAVLDASGRVKTRMDLESGTALMNRGPTGSLGPGRGRWIILRMYDADAVRRPLVVAFDGKTGEKLWVRDHYGNYGPNPVIFAAHLPTAVLDFDGDGVDDWLACSENFYGIISVKENRDLLPPVVLSNAVAGHWTAYMYPSLGKFGTTGEHCLLHNNSYAMTLITDLRGQPLWHEGMTRDTAGTWGILADMDGDGASEFIHAQSDGLIRGFGINARRARCATCPAEGATSNQPKEAPNPSRWSIDLKGPVSRFIAADLDADGRQELLLGGSDGNLYALAERSGRPLILWKVPLGRRAGEPILADLDGDNRAEILVATEDGRLYRLQGERGSTPP